MISLNPAAVWQCVQASRGPSAWCTDSQMLMVACHSWWLHPGWTDETGGPAESLSSRLWHTVSVIQVSSGGPPTGNYHLALWSTGEQLTHQYVNMQIRVLWMCVNEYNCWMNSWNRSYQIVSEYIPKARVCHPGWETIGKSPGHSSSSMLDFTYTNNRHGVPARAGCQQGGGVYNPHH